MTIVIRASGWLLDPSNRGRCLRGAVAMLEQHLVVTPDLGMRPARWMESPASVISWRPFEGTWACRDYVEG
jgi:hypothetical protein